MASECGFTEEHYKDLQQLQRDFGPYHFNVLAFPCNQFGQQEPGSDKDIDSFVRRVYGVSFPLFSKIAVVGTGANNAYKYLVGKFRVVAFTVTGKTLNVLIRLIASRGQSYTDFIPCCGRIVR